LTPDIALEQAQAAEKEIQRGHYRGPLHGIPYAAKDLLAVNGIPCTWAQSRTQIRCSITTQGNPVQRAAVVARVEFLFRRLAACSSAMSGVNFA